MTHPLWRRLVAEFLGSAFLAAIVIGSGIAAQQLSPGDVGLELFENAAATGGGPLRHHLDVRAGLGGHFNPVVSFVDAAFGGLRWRDAAAYLPAQVAGCIGGAVVANVMFAEAAISISTKHRASGAHFLSEIVATLGLMLVIFALARTGRSRAAPAAVGAYIGAAYFFTSSTSFANPAITVGRMFSDTFAGIAPSSAPRFVARPGRRRAAGRAASSRCCTPTLTPAEAADVIVPHPRRAARSDQRHPLDRSPAAAIEGDPRDRQARRAVPLHPQRRAEPGRPGPARPLRRRAASTSAPPAPSRPTSSTRRSSRSCASGDSTRPGSSPSPSPTRRPGPPTSSSPWAAATPARSTRASATSTGSSRTPPESRSRRSGPSSTRSTAGSVGC